MAFLVLENKCIALFWPGFATEIISSSHCWVVQRKSFNHRVLYQIFPIFIHSKPREIHWFNGIGYPIIQFLVFGFLLVIDDLSFYFIFFI